MSGSLPLQGTAAAAGGARRPAGRDARRRLPQTHTLAPPPPPSSYTPALIFGRGFGTDVENELAAGLIKDCASPRLNAAQQAECRACVAQRTKQGCLAQTARVTNTVGAHLGRGTQSCDDAYAAL